jgi:AraC family transcriptional regulator of adaptative response/methylated-DNA-[protein]-cysteine methyltransferase
MFAWSIIMPALAPVPPVSRTRSMHESTALSPVHRSSAAAHDDVDAARAWAAVMARDRAADGAFVYAVRTTGVYCRASCPSRRARRENVAFYADPRAAEAAGFRACLRCRPTEAAENEPAAVTRARAHIDAHLESRGDAPLPLAELAAAVGMSPAHLQRTFTRVVGLSPRAYRDARRVARLKERLRAGDTVSRATFEAGFAAGSGVYARADRALGMSPAAWRRGGRGERVAFAVVPTRLGVLLVAATTRGVCAVAMDDDEAALSAGCATSCQQPSSCARGWRRAPRAWPATRTRSRAGWTAATATPRCTSCRSTSRAPSSSSGCGARCVRSRSAPLDRTRSWRARSARRARCAPWRRRARPTALALVVPCHRIVRGDGATGGYRWGPDRKARLLEHERGG